MKFQITEIVKYTGKNFPYIQDEELIVTGKPFANQNHYYVISLNKKVYSTPVNTNSYQQINS